jgi:hypothetical protein
MKKTQTHYRQGDVLILPVSEIPTNLVKTKRVTLALGEVTGHHHTISNGAVGYADEPEALVSFFAVTDEIARLDHQEHSTIEIPKGTYKKVIQSSYTPEKLEPVRD